MFYIIYSFSYILCYFLHKKKVCFARFKNGFAEIKKKAFGIIPKAFFSNLFFTESYQSVQLIFGRKLSICGFSPCDAKVKRIFEFANFFYIFAVKKITLALRLIYRTANVNLYLIFTVNLR